MRQALKNGGKISSMTCRLRRANGPLPFRATTPARTTSSNGYSQPPPSEVNNQPFPECAQRGPEQDRERQKGGHALGGDRADASDHPGTEVLLDGLDRRGGRGLQEPRPKLLAMGAVVRPLARGRHLLTCGDHRCVAHGGDQIAMAPRIEPQNAEAVFRFVEGDPLDEARENFVPGVCVLTHATIAG